MSNASKPVKVLYVALKRLQKGWTKHKWVDTNKQTGVTTVCIEGAVYGFSTKSGTNNPACTIANKLILQVIQEKYQTPEGGPYYLNIPSFNDDPRTTLPHGRGGREDSHHPGRDGRTSPGHRGGVLRGRW